MIISRVIHFHKTVIKNPNLFKENYIIMGYSFLLGIIMAIKNKLNIIFFDDAN